MTPTVDWQVVSIGSYVQLINGFAFPSEGFVEGDGMPLIRIRDLGNRDTEVNFLGKYSERYLIKNGDLLIGMDGDFLAIRWKGNDALLNQRVCKLVTKDADHLAQEFLFYRISEEITKIHRITAATTVKHLSSNDVLKIEIRLPPRCEQLKIAEILSTVDWAIEQTEALIGKHQRIKTGLIQDLLTRGIDEHGIMRTEPSHAFKESELGRIPEEWTVKRLDQIALKIADRDHTTPAYVDDGVLMISPMAFCQDEDIDFLLCPRITEEAHQVNSRKTDCKPGDLILHRIGAGLGGVRMVKEEHPRFSILHSLALVRPDPKCIDGAFLKWAIRSFDVQKQMGLGTQSIGVPDLGLDKIGSLEIKMPVATGEQERIGAILDANQAVLNAQYSSREKLLSLKRALMQDLLTGKKRVTALLESRPPREKIHAGQ